MEESVLRLKEKNNKTTTFVFLRSKCPQVLNIFND